MPVIGRIEKIEEEYITPMLIVRKRPVVGRIEEIEEKYISPHGNSIIRPFEGKLKRLKCQILVFKK
jgi:hypothetical protein